MKAILVIDMPSCCIECPLYDFDTYLCSSEMETTNENRHDERMDWCPLKPMPQIKYISPNDTHDDLIFQMGWNACLDSIIGETDET